jgi:hypothetical protein
MSAVPQAAVIPPAANPPEIRRLEAVEKRSPHRRIFQPATGLLLDAMRRLMGPLPI